MILEGIVPRDRMASMALPWRMTRTKGTAHNLTTAGTQATTRTKGTVLIRITPVTGQKTPMATTARIRATTRMKDTADMEDMEDMPDIMHI